VKAKQASFATKSLHAQRARPTATKLRTSKPAADMLDRRLTGHVGSTESTDYAGLTMKRPSPSNGTFLATFGGGVFAPA